MGRAALNTLKAPTNRIVEHEYTGNSLAQTLQTLLHRYSTASICQYVDRRIGGMMRLAGVELVVTNKAAAPLELRFCIPQLSDASRSIITQSLETILCDMAAGASFDTATQATESADSANPVFGNTTKPSKPAADVASAFAHKLRNNLAAIISAGEQLEEITTHPDSDDSALLISLISRAAHEQRQIIDRFLQVFGQFNVQNQRVNLPQCVRFHLDQLLQRHGYRITCEGHDEHHHGITDPDLLGRIITELAANAAEAFPQDTPTLRWCVNHGRLIISVSNNSVVTPDQMYGEFLRPFFTSKPGHAGLGLNIVRRSVEALGGTLRPILLHDHTTLAVAIPIYIDDLTNLHTERNS